MVRFTDLPRCPTCGKPVCLLEAAASLAPAGLVQILEELGIFFRPSQGTRRRKIYVEGGRHALRYSTEVPKRSADGIANRDSLTGDRGFESISLQRGVYCDPDFRGRILSMTVGDFTDAAM